MFGLFWFYAFFLLTCNKCCCSFISAFIFTWLTNSLPFVLLLNITPRVISLCSCNESIDANQCCFFFLDSPRIFSSYILFIFILSTFATQFCLCLFLFIFIKKILSEKLYSYCYPKIDKCVYIFLWIFSSGIFFPLQRWCAGTAMW